MVQVMMKTFVLFLLVSSVALAGGECAEVGPAQSKWSVAAVGGTQGVGMSVGYRMNEYVGFRLRGAVMDYNQFDDWSGSQSTVKLNGDNAGLLVDIYPFGGKFYISAGLTVSECNMRYKRRFTMPAGGQIDTMVGSQRWIINGDAEISGKYEWNHLQPYLGIGYADTIGESGLFYYAVDLGINYMGSGNLRVGHAGNIRYEKEYGLKIAIGSHQVESFIREDGRDFFKIADNLHVYPVLQLSVGLRF